MEDRWRTATRRRVSEAEVLRLLQDLVASIDHGCQADTSADVEDFVPSR